MLAAFLARDWQIARARRGRFLIDAIGLITGSAAFYYLGRAFPGHRAEPFFAFAVGGITVLRLNLMVPRLLEQAAADRASGRLALLLCADRPVPLIVIGMVSFEVLRSAGLAAFQVLIAVVLFGAPLAAGAPAGLAVGLALGAVTFGGLACAALAALLVLRQAGAIGSLVLATMPLLAGAYFPTRTLPGALGTVAAALPFRRCVDLVRDGLLHGSFSAGTAGVLVLQAFGLASVGLVMVTMAVEISRSNGTLDVE